MKKRVALFLTIISASLFFLRRQLHLNRYILIGMFTVSTYLLITNHLDNQE